MKNLREVTAVSELLTANNEEKSTYVLLTFGCMIGDGGEILPQERRAFFCDAAFAKQLKPGLKLDVQPLPKRD